MYGARYSINGAAITIGLTEAPLPLELLCSQRSVIQRIRRSSSQGLAVCTDHISDLWPPEETNSEPDQAHTSFVSFVGNNRVGRLFSRHHYIQ